MIDQCSREAYDDLKDKGRVVCDQLSVLNVFRKFGHPMMAREVFKYCVADGISIDFNGVRSRITELTDQGLLEKFDKATDSETGKTVNRWRVRVVVYANPPTDLFLSTKV